MPSDKDPNLIDVGAGKLHSNVATAAADYQTSSGTSSLLAAALAALNQELVIPTVTGNTVSVGDTSIILSGAVNPIWVGDNPGDSLKDLFRLVQASNDSLPTDAIGDPIEVASIVGAAIGDGWFTGVGLTVNFTGVVPAGLTYRLYYGTRATLQSIPIEAFSFTTIRNSVAVDEDLQTILKELHSAGGDTWDDAWASTIDDLTKSGLNERYRLSTTGGSGTVDTAGDGALIHRDGQAMTLESSAALGSYLYPNTPSDPYSAHHKTTAGPGPQTDIVDRENSDGGTGYVNVQQQRLTTSSGMRMNALAYSLASRIDAIERHFSNSLIGTANIRTKIVPTNGSGTLLNPDAGTGYNDRRTIQLASGDYFWESISGNKTSEVAIGRDLIEITYFGGKKQVCVITELFGTDPRKARLLNLTGGGLSFPSGAVVTDAKFRFIKLKYWQGVGTQKFIDHKGGGLVTPNIELGHFYHAITPFISDDIVQSGEAEDIGDAEFYARARTVGNSGVAGLTTRPFALKWGGYDPATWEQVPSGGLRGDGAIEATLFSQKEHRVDVGSNGVTVINWHPSLQGSLLVVDVDHAAGLATITINIDIADYLTYVRQPGDRIEIHIRNPTAAPTPGVGVPLGATYTIAWSGALRFEGAGSVGSVPGGVPIIYNHTGIRTVNKWAGTWSSLDNDFMMHDETPQLGPGD